MPPWKELWSIRCFISNDDFILHFLQALYFERVSDIRINGFTDVHTHILPGIDDGAESFSVARKLVQAAWEDGTRTLFLTPHYRGKYKANTPQQLQEAFQHFQQKIAEDYPDMKLYLGQEVHYQAEVPDRLSEGQILTMGRSNYVLLEFRTGALRSQIRNGVLEVVRYGYTPIVAHAERYNAFAVDVSLADDVLELGALIQLNADSIMGKHGARTKNVCHKLLKAKQVHFVGTDTHDLALRTPKLRECFWQVHQKYGSEYAARVFYHNALAIIANQTL